MKKMISVVLALFMMISLSVNAFAAEPDDGTENSSITVDTSLDTLDLLIVAHFFLSSGTDENYWPEDVQIKEQIPLYNIDGQNVAWYIELSGGEYAVINNNVNNPAVIEFGIGGNYLIQKLANTANNSHIIYNNPSEVYCESISAAAFSATKDIYSYYPELKQDDAALAEALVNSRAFLIENNPIMVLGDGDYGFIYWDNMPAGEYESDWLSLYNVDWAITGDYNSFAYNHCGATCVTNLALYFAALNTKYSNLKINSSKDETFKAIYQIVGPGPVATIAGSAKTYFSSRGYTLKYSSVGTFDSYKTAIKNDRPCGILLADGLDEWHWVLGVGWRQYLAGGNYMRIVNGWDNTHKYFYKVNTGSLWISATEYWVE